MLVVWQRLAPPTLIGNKDQILGDKFKVISGKRSLFYEGGDNRLFERIWERAFNERIIYPLGNRWEEDIKTSLKEECWYRVQ